MNEELNFKIRAVAEGVEQATRKAAAEMNKLGDTYQETEKKTTQAKQATEELKQSQKEQSEETSKQRQEQKQTNEELGRVAAVTAAAAVAFRAITVSIKDGIAAYNQYVSAMRGLQAVAAGTGNSMAQLAKITEKMTSDGLITVSDVSAATKNLLIYGYTAEQAADILDRLKNSAAFNRQAHYSLGEAVRVTTEGIRMENSVLSDAAGVQKNIAKMYQEFAEQVGKTVESLTQAEKAQAVYNGIMAETEILVGNAAVYAQEFAGTQAQLEASTLRLKTAYGEAVSGGLKPFVTVLAESAAGLTVFIENNRVLVSVLVTLATTITGLIALVGIKTAAIKLLGLTAVGTAGGVATLGAALKALWLAAGPVGWVVAGIALVAGVIAGVGAAAEQARKKAEALREEIKALSETNKGAEKLISEYETISRKAIKTADDTQRMLDIRAELVESYGFSAEAIDAEGRLLSGNLEIMREQLAIQKEMLYEKLTTNAANDEKLYMDALKKRQKQLEKIAKYQAKLDEVPRLKEQHYSDQQLETYVTTWKGELDRVYKALQEGQNVADAAIQNMIKSMITGIELDGKSVPAAVQTTIIQAVKDALQEGLTYDEAMGTAQSIIDKFFELDASVANEKIAQVKQLRDDLLAIFSQPDIDTTTASAFINSILDALVGTQAQQDALARMEELKQKIVDGLASTGEMGEYDELINSFKEGINDASKTLTNAMLANVAGADQADTALKKLAKSYEMTSDQLRQAAVEAEAAKKTLKDAASDLRSVASAQEQLAKAFRDVANLKAAAQAIRDYNAAAEKTAELTEQNALAKQYLADYLDIEADAVEAALPGLDDQIALKEALALADYAVGLQAALTAQATIQAMIAQGTVTEEQGQKMTAALQKVIDKMAELGSTDVSVTGVDGQVTSIKPKFTYTAPKRSSGGGGSSKKNAALERELALLEHKKALDQVTTVQEIENLERILRKYAKTTEEKRSLTERLYALRMEKQRQDMDYQMAMDQLTLREEIRHIDNMIRQYKAGTDARKELEKERYALSRELERQEYDLKVYYGQITLEEQEKYLRKLIDTYKAGTQARIDLEKELYDVQQRIKQQGIDQLNMLTDGIVTALKARYDEQRKVEEARIKQSIESWRAWGEGQVKAIQAQINALDDLTQAEDRSEVERKKRREIAALEQQMFYEKDAYNQRKLQEQITKAREDLNSWLNRNEREDLKKALQNQINSVNETVRSEEDRLNAQLTANNNYYDELTKQANLQAEAQRIIMKNSQQEIVDLMKAFAPEYNLTGQTLGEQLYAGFMSKVGSLEAWFDSLADRVREYQAQLAGMATAAADRFYSTHGYATSPTSSGATCAVTASGPVINMYFNQPVDSPTEIRREMERLMLQLAQM